MTTNQFSEVALDHLRRLAKGPGVLPDDPELEVLWTIRYVMGKKSNAHITQSGKAFIVALDAPRTEH